MEQTNINNVDTLFESLDTHNENYALDFDEKKLSDVEDTQFLLEMKGIKPTNADGSLNMQYIRAVSTSKSYLVKAMKNQIAFRKTLKEVKESVEAVEKEKEEETNE